jgi:hypothetical protein
VCFQDFPLFYNALQVFGPLRFLYFYGLYMRTFGLGSSKIQAHSGLYVW